MGYGRSGGVRLSGSFEYLHYRAQLGSCNQPKLIETHTKLNFFTWVSHFLVKNKVTRWKQLVKNRIDFFTRVFTQISFTWASNFLDKNRSRDGKVSAPSPRAKHSVRSLYDVQKAPGSGQRRASTSAPGIASTTRHA